MSDRVSWLAPHGSGHLFLQAMAAWDLARAANAYFRPQAAADAAARARAAFADLGATGWVAACDWQANALPWTRPHLDQVIATLQSAVAVLANAGVELTRYLPDAYLALAHAQILASDDAQAAQNLDRARALFTAQADPLGESRCLLARSAGLRRQSRFQEATACTEEALARLSHLAAPVDTAIATCQMAYNHWLLHADYPAAEAAFQQAAEQFTALDLPLWLGQCDNGRAQLYITTGRLAEAGQALQRARAIFTEFETPGPLAATLLDNGWLEMARGRYQSSLDDLAQAEALARQAGNPWLRAAAFMHQGEAYLHAGRYQDALFALEEAHRQFQPLHSPGRLAECELRLARVWTRLGQPPQAHAYLDHAGEHFQQTGHASMASYLCQRRAEVYLVEQRPAEALASLQEGVAVALAQGNAAAVAQAQRLLGQALIAAGRLDEAAAQLGAAEQTFAQMELVVESALCQVAWGHLHQQSADAEAARAAWQRALDLSEELIPDVSWLAHAGLGALAAAGGDTAEAIRHYRRASQALSHIRRGLWQPALTGSFLTHPAATLDQAVLLAVDGGFPKDALGFIEESKAQSVARHFNVAPAPELTLPLSQAAMDLAAEIRWLWERLHASPGAAGWLGAPQERQWRAQLKQKTRQYDALIHQLERQHLQGSIPALLDSGFEMSHFRRLAATYLPADWLALDFYLSESHVVSVMVTPTSIEAWSVERDGRLQLALNAVGHSGHLGHEGDLTILGQELMPRHVWERLTPDTTLVIAPHRGLHRLPWAALRVGPAARPLAAEAVPVVVPSCYSLAQLWQRPAARRPLLEAGLIVAVPEFAGRHAPLPEVLREVREIAACFGPGSRQLLGPAATWSGLLQLSNGQGLRAFTCLHIASHAFHDDVTGRLSGLALHDRDVWLDDLWQLAPLPPLVTLSACSANRSLIYEGDEHVGLAITCLVAGAQHVITSLWPISDSHTPRLMSHFYGHLAAGEGVGRALALAQRRAWEEGEADTHWGSFRCTGLA